MMDRVMDRINEVLSSYNGTQDSRSHTFIYYYFFKYKLVALQARLKRAIECLFIELNRIIFDIKYVKKCFDTFWTEQGTMENRQTEKKNNTKNEWERGRRMR